MADQESEKLCAKLMGVVADVPANEFYNRFNLEGHSFAEFYLKDMMRIFHLPGMELWPRTQKTKKQMHIPKLPQHDHALVKMKEKAYLITKMLLALLLLIISENKGHILRCCGLQQHDPNLPPWKAYMLYGEDLVWLRIYSACW